jgi:hypothetical protein
MYISMARTCVNKNLFPENDILGHQHFFFTPEHFFSSFNDFHSLENYFSQLEFEGDVCVYSVQIKLTIAKKFIHENASISYPWQCLIVELYSQYISNIF